METSNISPEDLPENFILVIVHPGSFYGPARSDIPEAVFSTAEAGMMEALDTCSGLVVIDGSMSEVIPANAERRMRQKLADLAEEGRVSIRAWGDDAGDEPYPGWSPWPAGHTVLSPCQEEAAAKIATMLEGNPVICAGAWASRDGVCGCVNGVAMAFEGSGLCDVRIAGFCAFEGDVEPAVIGGRWS